MTTRLLLYLLAAVFARGAQLTVSTPLGQVRSIAVDPGGYIYLAGTDPAVPPTPGAINTVVAKDTALYCHGPQPPPCSTAFIAKLDAVSMKLLWLGYLGGNHDDEATAIAVDPAGNAYVAGFTTSTDFPVTTNASRKNSVFVTKVNSSGTALAYSTLIGSMQEDCGVALAVDASGNAYIAGGPPASDFPVTPGAFSTATAGIRLSSGFVTKLNSTGNQLVYSGLFNGCPAGIAVDQSGSAYVAGMTYGGLTTTPGSYQPKPGGGYDAFVMKINPAGTSLIYSTYLGGPDGDQASAIAIDPEGNAYVGGATYSLHDGQLIYDVGTGTVTNPGLSPPAFPTTTGAFETEFGGSFRAGTMWDGFAAKLSADGAKLLYSTFLGGGSVDGVTGVAVDSNGNAVLVGSSDSDNFPTTPDGFEPCMSRSKLNSGFLVRLDAEGRRMLYGTRLDGGYGGPVAMGSSGSAYTVSGGAPARVDFTQPPPELSLTCVANAANYVAGIVAPREIVTLFGTGLEGGRAFFDYFLDEIEAQVLFSGPNQINLVVPDQVAATTGLSIRVEVAGNSTNAIAAQVVNAENGIFTVSGRGSGQALVINDDGTLNSPTNPAARGSVVTFFTTGMGHPMRHYEVYIHSSTGSEVLAVDEITPGVVRFRARIPMDANPGSTMPFVVVIDRDYTDALYNQQITTLAIK